MLAPWQNPKPTAFALVDGQIVEPTSFEFAVDDATGTELSAFAAAVDKGHGVYEATAYATTGSAGRRTIRWRFRLAESGAGSDWITWSSTWETVRLPSATPVYALIADLRDEGITTTMLADARARMLLVMASIEVSKFTGRLFGARDMTLLVDGRNGPVLQLEEPIVAMREVVIGAESLTSTESALEAEAYRVYNRHMQGLVMPDDRENPKVELRHYGPRRTWASRTAAFGERSRFVEGQQNVRVGGVFGYTELDGSPAGGIPYLITRATMLMVARLSAQIGNPSTGIVSTEQWRVVEEKTRDQSVRFADLGSTAAVKSGTSLRGAFTGDPEIDTILAMYARGPRFSAA